MVTIEDLGDGANDYFTVCLLDHLGIMFTLGPRRRGFERRAEDFEFWESRDLDGCLRGLDLRTRLPLKTLIPDPLLLLDELVLNALAELRALCFDCFCY